MININQMNNQPNQCFTFYPLYLPYQNYFTLSNFISNCVTFTNKDICYLSEFNDKTNPNEIPEKIKDKLIDKMLKNNLDINFNQMNQLNNSNFTQNSKDNNNTSSLFSKERCPNHHFTKEEDEKIKELVDIYGTKNWSEIASHIKGRTAKQCRDRYSNYLTPGFFQGEWTKEEDEILTKLYNENGSKWSIIKSHLPNRSSNCIKNRWHYFLSKSNVVEEEANEYNESDGISIDSKLEKNIEGKNKFQSLINNDQVETNESKSSNSSISTSTNKDTNEALNDVLFRQENEIFENINSINLLDSDFFEFY